MRRLLPLATLAVVLAVVGWARAAWADDETVPEPTTVATVPTTVPATVPATTPPPTPPSTVPSRPERHLRPSRAASRTSVPASAPRATSPTSEVGYFVSPPPYIATSTSTTVLVPVEAPAPYVSVPVPVPHGRLSGWDWAVVAGLALVAVASFTAAALLGRAPNRR